MAVGCVIGYFAFKYSTNTHPGLPATRGDVVGAIGVTCAVITVLMLLFGDIGKGQQVDSTPPKANTPSVTLPPSPSAQRN
ncbi:hypothetical protein PV569_26795 [Streptomyces scabiei]|uniref:hypothetical protein n=1 Tax=Streptomyces scabiei TaxID=1930 RepID=UPI000AFB4D2E|nr:MULTISPECIES: hypothetical protein [Streptomyces]MDX3297278.1 hypothetical protein [Streptomyces scabiei]